MIAANFNVQRVMKGYLEVYQKLYRRQPSELRDLGGNWVLVNGARMTLRELEQLTAQLQLEFQSERDKKRSVLQRLVGWFAKTG